MQKLNIAKPEKYTDKSGIERTKWDSIGSITIFDKDNGSKSYLVEIPAIGLKANAFPVERKDDPARPASFPRQGDITQDENPF